MPAIPDILNPLVECYCEARHALPGITRIEPEAMPEPYRRLLVHERDMTSTLEKFHGDKMALAVRTSFTVGTIYVREVVLLLQSSRTPVEYGAIQIHLPAFPAEAQKRILEGGLPLGAILHQFSLGYVSRPKAFIRVESDAVINHALGLSGLQTLFGRCNGIYDANQKPLADIVEILPPIRK